MRARDFLAGPLRTRAFWWDLAERLIWTGIQTVLGVVTVDSLHLPLGYAPLIAVVLSAVKSYVAGKVGQAGTASMLPASKDPAVVAAQVATQAAYGDSWNGAGMAGEDDGA